ncbi:MAG: class I SAM-dependent methyltransferase [Defluviitaleaceae bacterium]|nr:class I SAM-dependent methyltransferase [Defluviitaleaceae bacterium]
MNCYEGFASMYDALMTDAPYDTWAAYINDLLATAAQPPFADNLHSGQHARLEASCSFQSKKLLVLDLACGTGNITLRLAKMGYDLIGVDASEDMLAEANRKAYEQGEKILFLAQDMRELDLYGTVDAVVCVCDGMNYILTDEDLLTVFKRVRLFLNAGGVFMFDMNTEYKFKEFENLIFEDKGEGGEAYEWQNHYNPETKINEYHMTFYYENDNDNTESFSELHRQRAYPLVDVCNMLIEAGFVSVAMRDDYTSQPPKAESTRVVFIAAG